MLPPRHPGALAAAAGWGGVLCPRARRLLAGAALLGLGSSAYWTFAVAHLVDAGALSAPASRTCLGVVGVAGVLATATSDVVRRLGVRRASTLLLAIEAAGVALLAVAPSSLAAALASAVMFGAAYNAAVGVQALWSTHVFAARPSLGDLQQPQRDHLGAGVRRAHGHGLAAQVLDRLDAGVGLDEDLGDFGYSVASARSGCSPSNASSPLTASMAVSASEKAMSESPLATSSRLSTEA